MVRPPTIERPVMKKTRTKISSWIHAHRNDLLFGSLIIGAVAASVTLEIHNLNETERANARLTKFTVEQNKLGRTVYQLADGSHISVNHNDDV